MKKLKIIFFLFGLFLLTSLIFRVGFKEIFGTLIQAKIQFLILGLGIYLLLVATRALKWFLLLRATGVKIGYKEFLPFYFVNSLMGNITPFKSGEAVTPFLFKKYLKIPAGQGFSIVIFDRFFELMFFSFILLGVLLYLISGGSQNQEAATLLQFALLAFILLLLLFVLLMNPKISAKFLVLWKKFSFSAKGANFLEKELKVFYETLKGFQNKDVADFMALLTGLGWFLEFLAFYLVINSVLHIPFFQAVASQTISMAATFVTFVPGGIGIGELGAVSVLRLFGYPLLLSTAAVLAARIVLTGTVLLLGLLGSILVKERSEAK